MISVIVVIVPIVVSLPFIVLISWPFLSTPVVVTTPVVPVPVIITTPVIPVPVVVTTPVVPVPVVVTSVPIASSPVVVVVSVVILDALHGLLIISLSISIVFPLGQHPLDDLDITDSPKGSSISPGDELIVDFLQCIEMNAFLELHRVLPVFGLVVAVLDDLVPVLQHHKFTFKFVFVLPAHIQVLALALFGDFSAQIPISTNIDIDDAEPISIGLFFAQFLFVGPHCREQAIGVDERQDDLPEPSKFLSHQIDDKIAGVVIDYGRLRIQHIKMQEFRQGRTSLRRQNSHQLLKGPKRSARLEFLRLLLRHVQVSEEGGIVEGVVPRPTGHSTIVISAYPSQGLNVATTHIVLQFEELPCTDLKLFLVVLLLV